jgi:MFS transporter, putative metabolite:H+ symporter
VPSPRDNPQAAPTAVASSPRLTAYQKKLFVFLSVATFFEGYDFIALTQLLPELRAGFALDEWAGGLMVSVINFGTVIAYLLVRHADRWGRRRVLTLTIAGYTIFTFASGLAPNVFVFAGFQLVARMFLIAEWVTSMVLAAEEFPAARRGMVIGVIQGCSSLGSIACAGLVPILLKAPWGWRTVYFVGIIPLIILAIARRGLRESHRFVEEVGRQEERRSFLYIWKTPHRKRMLQLGLIWALTYVCTHNAITFWKEFAMAERGLTDAEVGTAISIAAVGSMPLVFYSGRLIDQIGRRSGAVVIFLLGATGVVASYGLSGFWPLTMALVFGIFGASAVLPVLNAYNTELFPTKLRGDAFAWSNNILGRIGYVLSPAGVGALATSLGWGPAVQLTAIGPVLALALILTWLPETRSRELEDTAQV